MDLVFSKSEKSSPVLPSSVMTVAAFVLELVEVYATSSDSRSFMKEFVEDIGLNVHDVVEILVICEERFQIEVDDECIDPDDISELRVGDLVGIIEVQISRGPERREQREGNAC